MERGENIHKQKKRLLNKTKNFFYSNVNYKNKLSPIMKTNKEEILGGDNPGLAILRSETGLEPSVHYNEIQKYTIGQRDDPIRVPLYTYCSYLLRAEHMYYRRLLKLDTLYKSIEGREAKNWSS